MLDTSETRIQVNYLDSYLALNGEVVTEYRILLNYKHDIDNYNELNINYSL